jgi:hypothetical protein
MDLYRGIKGIKKSNELITLLESGIKEINQLSLDDNIKIKISDILPTLKRKIENLDFLKEVDDKTQYALSEWVSDFNLTHDILRKGNNLFRLQSLVELNSYLTAIGVNINSSTINEENIKDQIHTKLTHFPPSFQAKYSGIVSYSGSQNYSGTTSYSGSKDYSGVVSVKKCSHEWKGSVPCVLCNGLFGNVDYKDHHYSGTVHYDGVASYSGSVPYSGYKTYSGSHTVTCDKDHHHCVCDKWPPIVLGFQELLQEIEYYKNVSDRQKALLKVLEIDASVPPLTKSSNLAKLKSSEDLDSFLTRMGININWDRMSATDIKGQIHTKLTQSPPSIEASYSGRTLYSGSQSYSGTTSYSGSKTHPGIRVISCSYDCSKCEGKSYRTYGSGTVYYNGVAPYSNSVSYDGYTTYSGSHTVTCDKDHHHCSCEEWASIILSFRELFEEKAYHKEVIAVQKRVLTRLMN